MKRALLQNRRWIAEVMQALIAGAALIVSFLLRFEFSIEPPYGHMLLESLPLLVAVKIVVFRAFGLRDVAWRDIGFADLLRIGVANAGASGVTAIVLRLALGPAFPRSLLALDFFVCLTLTVALRAAVKSLLEWRHRGVPGRADHADFEIDEIGVDAYGLDRILSARQSESKHTDDQTRCNQNANLCR